MIAASAIGVFSDCRFHLLTQRLVQDRNGDIRLAEFEKNKGVRCVRTNRWISLPPGHTPECL